MTVREPETSPPGTTPQPGFPAPWRSPADQPRWARPALLSIAAAATVIYVWGISTVPLNDYYAPAVRSMSESWKAWLYGGYDPQASITLDKLPGSFMVQALFVRVLGFHTWVIILPQVIAAVLSILVLYRIVRRWQGPVAGLLAAGLLATTPMLAAEAHSQVAEGILVLLLILAADAAQRAYTTGRLQPLLLCAVFIGLAFQTKMVQAWGVIPAFALAYLVAAPPSLPVRLRRLSLAGLLTLAISLWQVALFALTPATSRPYADGTTNNSLLTMIFEYNLSTRFGSGDGSAVDGPGGGGPRGNGAEWGYVVSRDIGPQINWLLPLALIGLVLGLVGWRSVRRGGLGRLDAVRAGYLMWGVWLAVHIVAFSTGNVAHTFYVITLSPAVAALAAVGAVELGRRYLAGGAARWLVPLAVAFQGLWVLALCAQFANFQPWLGPVVAVILLVALVLLVVGSRRSRQASGTERPAIDRLVVAGAAIAVVGVLLAPATWSALTVKQAYAGSAGAPYAGPMNPGGGTMGGGAPPGGNGQLPPNGPNANGGTIVRTRAGAYTVGETTSTRDLLDYLNAQRAGEKYTVATEGPGSGGPLLLAGADVLPMGGISGEARFPTLPGLAKLVADKQLRYVLLGGPADIGNPGPRENWVIAHCGLVPPGAYHGAGDLKLFDCRAAGGA